MKTLSVSISEKHRRNHRNEMILNDFLIDNILALVLPQIDRYLEDRETKMIYEKYIYNAFHKKQPIDIKAATFFL